MERYARNMGTLSPHEQELLARARVAVIGCGGLGGYLIEMLGRIGIGQITAVDGDVFETSNLNRQLYATGSTLGQSKAQAAAERMRAVNPQCCVQAVLARFDGESEALLAGQDLVMDALDSVEVRLMLERVCKERGIPLIHSAVERWYGQVCTVLPGDDSLARWYGDKRESETVSTPSFTPAVVAGIAVSEGIKLLLGRGELLRSRMLLIDLLTQEFTTVAF